MDSDDLILTLHGDERRSRQVDTEGEERSQRAAAPDFGAYRRATAVRTVQCWPENRQGEPWDRTRSRETDRKYSPRAVTGSKGNTRRKDGLFNEWAGPPRATNTQQNARRRAPRGAAT